MRTQLRSRSQTHARTQVRVGRAYGRVSRRLLRQHLLGLAKDAGVCYLAAAVEDVQTSDDGMTNVVTCDNGQVLRSRCGARRALRLLR